MLQHADQSIQILMLSDNMHECISDVVLVYVFTPLCMCVCVCVCVCVEASCVQSDNQTHPSICFSQNELVSGSVKGHFGHSA